MVAPVEIIKSKNFSMHSIQSESRVLVAIDQWNF